MKSMCIVIELARSGSGGGGGDGFIAQGGKRYVTFGRMKPGLQIELYDSGMLKGVWLLDGLESLMVCCCN